MQTSTKWIEGLGPHSMVEDAARRSLEPRLTSVVHLLPLAAHLAAHDIEHVHRLRVATRRAGAALRLYRDCVAPKPSRWLKKKLRKIRRAAGDARDLDVLAERLMRDYGEPVAPIIELIKRDRAAVQPAILGVAEECREDDRFVRKTAALLKSLDREAAGDDEAKPILFQEWAAKQFTEVADKFAAAMPNELSDPPALHEFRICGKALRYAIELVASAFGPELRKELYPMVEKLQERLGNVQDHVAAIDRCRAWAAATRNEALHETLRELGEAEHRGLTDSIHAFRSWWTDERAAQVRILLEFPARATPDPPVVHQT
jgi:CHAD domain-containing protein